MVLLAVDLIGTHVNEALDAGNLGGLQQHVGAEDVVLGKLERVTEGVIDVGLGCEVHDSVNLLILQYKINKIGTADVSLYKLVVGKVFNLVQVGQAGTVCKEI